MNKLTFVAAVLCFCLVHGQVDADTISYWNFNTYDGDASSIVADTGSGTINIDASWAAADLDDFAGSTTNALGGDPAGASLSLIDQVNNGSGLNIEVDTSTFENLELSFATRGTATGFSSNSVMYSSDGGMNFTPLVGVYAPGTSFVLQTFDFSSVTSLNDNSNVVLRILFDGATSGSGNNRIDNLQINGDTITTVPEPTHAVLLGVLGLGALLRRRNQALQMSPGAGSQQIA